MKNNYEPDKELPVAPIVSGKNDHGEIINADYWHAPTDREMLCLAYGALKVHMQGRDNPVTTILDEYLFPKPVMIAAAPEAGAKE